MAAPNMIAAATVTGKTSGVALVTGGVTILENPAASGKVFRVNTVTVANVDGTNSADATVSFVDATGPATTRIASTTAVPADSTLVVITRDRPIYLEEGDKITGAASADGDLEALESHEEWS